MKKRILAFILIIAILAAFAVNAGAAGTGTIKITNLNDGESYTVYKVFDIEYNATTGAYRYVLPAEFADFLTYTADIIPEDPGPAVAEAMTTYFIPTTVGGKTYISADFNPNSSQSAVAAQLVKSYMDSRHVTGTECSGTLENKEYGYYLLASSVGDICTLGTLVPASVGDEAMLTLREKNLPGGIGGGGVDKESVANGEEFTYTLTITSPERGKDFTIHDYSTDINIDKASVTIAGITLEGTHSVTTHTPGTLFSGLECPSGCNMHISFSSTVELPAYTEIKVTYKATKAGNNPTNGATVEIRDIEGGNVIKPPMASEPSSFSLWKEDGVTKAMIDGATFIAYKIDDGTKYYAKFIFNGAYTYSFSGWSKNYSDATPITVGACWIYGLPEGTFYFDEIDAPDGYIKADGPIVIEITETAGGHTVSYVSGGNARFVVDTLYVPNTPGKPLPETGGIGTTIFYVGGGILVLGALVILFMKKRNTAD